MGPLALRQMTAEDWPALLGFWAELAQAHGSQPSPAAETSARLDRLLAAGHGALMITLAGRPVGHVLWRDMGDHVFVRHFVLTASARGAGLGRAAFRLLEARWPDAAFRLDAADANPAARRFWASLGFEATAVAMRRPGPEAVRPQGAAGGQAGAAFPTQHSAPAGGRAGAAAGPAGGAASPAPSGASPGGGIEAAGAAQAGGPSAGAAGESPAPAHQAAGVGRDGPERDSGQSPPGPDVSGRAVMGADPGAQAPGGDGADVAVANRAAHGSAHADPAAPPGAR